MYNLKRNNYRQNPKNSTIYTLSAVSQFIFKLLRGKINVKKGIILDPCVGKGSLLKPWKENECWTYGIDVEKNSSVDLVKDFLNWDGEELWRVFFSYSSSFGYRTQLVLCNPPFNGYGNKLGSEVWLDKIIELFGKDIPIVLFAPVGFCANLTLNSKRLEKFHNGTYPPISSIITLPKNIFEGVIFHCEHGPDTFCSAETLFSQEKGLEILIFNIKGLKGHYFLKAHESTI